ncbi:Monocarboxylate transporter 12 [Holothuria leucospilota]|uniref:Monocarboxylate transporter 12 n=1 Tax=Holothuria leucospilota TaxID=206669 RepID=A0A9Q1C9J3_HOLLE|nr:Monocarboxylate transporter 12 [Holothuria leucospilota]
MALKAFCYWLQCCSKIPKWIGSFLSLFMVNAFLMGSGKLFGVFFRQLSSQLGLNGSVSGLIFVIPSAVSHIMSPLVGTLFARFSCRQLGTCGGFLLGSNFILIGLFATNWMHFLLLAVGAGVGFGLLFFPAVISLHSLAGDNFLILMPLASTGSCFGVAVLPVISELFLQQYGLHAAFYLFGALAWHTIPCSLLLDSKPVRGAEKVIDHEVNRDAVQRDGQNIASTQDDGIFKIAFKFLITVGKQFRMFRYTLFVIIFIATNIRRFVSDTWTLFLIPHNVEMGLEKTTAVVVASFGGVGGIIGRLLAAVAFTKTCAMSPLGALTVYYVLCGISFVAFEVVTNVYYFYFCSFCNGLLLSAQSGMIAGIIAEVFEPPDFRDAFGLIDFGCGVFSLVSGYIAGGVYDLTGSFKMLFRISALVSVVSASLIVVVIILRKRSFDKNKGDT